MLIDSDLPWSSNMLEFTDDNFNSEVLFSEGLVVADFWASWCRPCHALMSTLEKVAAQNPGVKFGKVNIDENSHTTQTYGINAVPTVILFKNGLLVKRFVGLQNESVLNEAINANI
jgi:thioredoxin 1